LADAQACLDGLVWSPGEFDVLCDGQAEADLQSGRLVRFPSPVPSGNTANDSVSMEWYQARDADDRVIQAPAVLVVHESGANMPVGRLFARSLCLKGIHAFLIHLPYYGQRRPGDFQRDGHQFLTTMRQAIADVRRARDAISVLPNIEARPICVQGTSLGGFVVATCAGLDRCFDGTFIMLAGGDLYGMVIDGQKDTANLRERLAGAGYTGRKLQDLLWHIEPNRVAHRLDPQTTWLYSAEQDSVVPLKNALALAEAAELDDTHHVRVLGNHYTAIIHFPAILDHMVQRVRALAKGNQPK
jgi:dienelactone hydrolase